MGTSFFDTFFDNEYKQRSDLNDLARNETAMADDIATLGAQVRALKGQVRDLSMTLAVLVKMLEEAGHVDAKIMKYRVEAMVEEMTPANSSVRCFNCARDVPAARTIMTGNGPICDPGCAPR